MKTSTFFYSTLIFSLYLGDAEADSLFAGSGTVGDISEFQSISEGSGTSSYSFIGTQITGLTKFDSSLGTLNDVILTGSFDYQFSFSIFGDALEQEDPYSINGSANTDAGFFVSNGSSAIGVVSDFLEANAFCTGGVEGCQDVDTVSTYINSVQGNVNSGYLSAFIGVGPVTGLSAGFYFPLDSALVGVNTDPYAEGEANMTNIAYSVEYVYTPIPEPSTALLLAFISAGAIMRRKR